MKIDRLLLSEAMKSVLPATSKKDNGEQYSSFVFDNGRLFTFNNEIAISTPIDIGFTGAVPADKFMSLVNKVKTAEISLTYSKGELLLTGSKAKAGLRVEQEITLPLEELGMPEDWIELPETFCEGIKFCLFSASTDESKKILMNIHIKGEFIESCDNYRVTRYDMGEGSGMAFPDELLILADSAKSIIASNPVEYATTTGWLHFRNANDLTFSCRFISDEYPNFDKFLDGSGVGIVFPPTLPEVMSRASVMGDGQRVTLILEPDELIVTAENDYGWFEESIDIEYDGTPSEFDIQPEFMATIMKFKGSATITKQTLHFDSENFVHVVKLLAPKPRK